jgi:chorismate mutase
MENDRFLLSQIAAFLEGLEESIIYKLLDRAQFLRNSGAYQIGLSGFEAWPEKSCLDVRLYLQECMDARFGRFLVPEERPYSRDLPDFERKVTGLVQFPEGSFECISQSWPILTAYNSLLDNLCSLGDDGQWGSAVEHDVFCLQALGRRIHYGSLYVAEAKFRLDPEGYSRLVLQGDQTGLMKALTREDVELRILERVARKVDVVQGLVNPEVRRLVDPGIILDFYRCTIIPLTKAGELAYLQNRVLRLSES